MGNRKNWSDEELIITCDIFLHEGSNPDSIRHGMILTGRNNAAISMRYGNYEYYQTNGQRGLKNGGVHAEKIWNKYANNPPLLSKTVNDILANGLIGASSNSEAENYELEILLNTSPGKYREALTKQRVNQDILRKKALIAAGHKCCLTGISDEKLLIASHIKDWSVCTPKEKTDVHNALCLNVFHDGLFDKYLMTISQSGKIYYSSQLKDTLPEKIYQTMILNYSKIEFNNMNQPSPEYIKYHNNKFEMTTGEKIPHD